MAFMQLHDNFKPKDFDRLKNALEAFPKGFPLAVEVRNEEWFSDEKINDEFCALLESLNMANIIVGTAGRRDMMHMRLTNPVAFIRYVGANHESDYDRLDEWVERIKTWKIRDCKNSISLCIKTLKSSLPCSLRSLLKT